MVAGALAPFAPSGAAAQAPAPNGAREETFTVFQAGRVIGTELVSVTRTESGWTISASGRLNPPIDLVTRQLTLRYDSSWKPLELTMDATGQGRAQTIHTTIQGMTATTEIGGGGQPQPQVVTATTDADVFMLNLHFAAFEAVAARLRDAAAGSTMSGFQPAQLALSIRVGESTQERIQTPGRTIDAKHSHVTVTASAAGAPPIDLDIWADANGRLLRLSIPSQFLEVMREDISSPSTRQVTVSRPNDEAVRIAGNGFTLAGTVSKPLNAAAGRLPAVLLIGGSGATDRDELLFGIPIFGQLADAIADAGFLVLRYDKRGVGQSGGRPESATLADYADDARAAVKFLADRKDVDEKRIAVVGHSEGGAVAMIAGARDKRIAAIALVAAIGVSGAEVNLEQVKHAVERTNQTEAQKQATVALQRKIQQAVLTGSGWGEVAQYRRQADTPWFQSFLAFDPATVMPDIRQPLMIVQGELDTQVPPANADRLRALANARKSRSPVQIVKVPGVNHLLVAASTGEADEYPNLKDKHISADVTKAIVSWLQTTLAAK